jgi:N-acetylmuramoyl-L-alanine amidase
LIKKYNYVNLIILLIFLLFYIPDQNILAQQNDIQLKLNDTILNTNVSPILVNGRIFLPARDIIEALGGRITWFPALKLLNLNLGGKEVSLVIDIPEAQINGKKVILEDSPTIMENRVMIPLEVVQLLTEIESEWDKASQEISITSHRPYVTSIRSYSHKDKTRIVIDLSEKSSYQVITLSNPERVVVDVEASLNQLNEKQKEVIVNDSLVSRVRSGQFTQETVRVVTDLKGKYEFQVSDLSSPDRIVVDIFIPQSQVGTVVQTEISQEIKTEITKDGKRHIVVIDPGHGGNHPGAIGPSGLREKDVVLDIALKLRKILQDNGLTVYLTREKDVDIPLENRPLIAMQREANVFISIHTNSAMQKGSSTAKGIETYVLNSRYIGASAKDVADRENKASQFYHYEDDILNQIIADLEESASIGFSLDFAEIVQKRLVQNTGLENRGVKQAPFLVLKGVNMAAILVEVGFISNPNEEKLLKTPEFREKVAKALNQAVLEYVRNIPENI